MGVTGKIQQVLNLSRQYETMQTKYISQQYVRMIKYLLYVYFVF